ncbi:MAG: hypothetical protein NVSMB47_10230 [Polyangiales bacterium]
MGFVYGDSSPFPYELDYIALVRKVVQCGARLLHAQTSIDEAQRRRSTSEQSRLSERARLDRITEAVRQAMQPYGTGPERQVRVAGRVVDSARFVVDGELTAIESGHGDEIRRAEADVQQARRDVFDAIEGFLRSHDVPGTEVGLRLFAEDEAYAGQVTVTAPFGVEAIFHAAIPEVHEWKRARRVGELAPGTEIHVPQESGFFSKRIEPRPVRLDKLFVAEIAATSAGSRISLKKALRSGPGYELEISAGVVPRATLHELDDEGLVTGSPPLTLDDEDSTHVFRMWNAILASTQDLMQRRETMRSATFDGTTVLELDVPRAIVAKMVDSVAPTVREIERRSGTPRELVLRRDLGEGRRQETYVTKAELQELVISVAPSLRSVFAPFELDEVQRLSLRARKPEVEEVSAELVIDDDA